MGKRLSVEGIAVVEGISRNNVMYQADELHKFAPSLIGRPILKDHINLTDNVIGKVTHSESINNGKKVRFKGWITNDKNETMEKVIDGRINNVSIGAQAGKMVKEKEDSEYIIAKDMTALELSLTPVPGVPDASIMPSSRENIETENEEEEFSEEIDDEEFEEMISEGITLLNESLKTDKSKLNLNKEEIKMEGNEVKDETQPIVDDSEKKELEAKLDEAMKVIETYKTAERNNAIETYKKLCVEKGITAQDTTNLSMETIKAFTAMVESIKVSVKEADENEAEVKAEAETPVEPAKEEPVKEQAKTKVAEKIDESSTKTDKFGYVVEYSDLGGMAFYKSY